MLDLIILLLILLPIEPLPQTVSEPVFSSLKRVSVCLDLTGDVEKWTFNFAAETRWCRRSWKYVRSFPPSNDSHRLPPFCHVQNSRYQNLDYQRYLYLRQAFEFRRFDYSEKIAEAKKLYEIWEHLLTATDSRSWILDRRRALHCLRSMIGPEAYYAGDWPSCIPCHQLVCLDN